MNVLSYIIIGGIIGWAASLILNTNPPQGTTLNITIGVIGAVIGAFLLLLIRIAFGGWPGA